MKKLYKVLFLIYCTQFIHIAILAGDSTAVHKKDSVYPGKKICSCQLFNVKSTDNAEYVFGFFAEKTLAGKALRNFRLMDEYIRLEKNYFEIVFVRSAVLLEKFKEETDCRTLYNRLISEKRSFKLYNIIEVDALNALAKN